MTHPSQDAGQQMSAVEMLRLIAMRRLEETTRDLLRAHAAGDIADATTYCPYCSGLTCERAVGDDSITYCSECDRCLEGEELLSAAEVEEPLYNDADVDDEELEGDWPTNDGSIDTDEIENGGLAF